MTLNLANLKRLLEEKNLDALIVTNPYNISYLSGFKGASPHEREALLVITPNKSTLITARLYQIEAQKLESAALAIKIANERNEIDEFIKNFLINAQGVGFEEHDLKFSEHKKYKKLIKGTKLIPAKHFVEDLRVIKTTDEIKNIKRAQTISQKAFEQIMKTIKVGQTEAEIAEKLAQIIKSLGGQDLAFDSIVASGPNSAKPHHVTGNRRLTTGDTLLFDFGAKYKDYCADCTRTVFIGKASDEQINIYNHVFQAQQKSIKKIKDGIKASSAYKESANYFKKHKLDNFFIHSLGHGIGLQVHEKPSLSLKSKDVLKESMVFSVEPGLYFPEQFGVRIEDLVTIRGGKAQILGTSAKFMEI